MKGGVYMVSICEVCGVEKECMELDIECTCISIVCEDCRNQIEE